MNHSKKLGLCGALSLCLSCSLVFDISDAAAMDSFFVGPRALGMAGANIASTNDTTAQYYNPAAFGFFAKTRAAAVAENEQAGQEKIAVDNNNMGRKSWGVGVGGGTGYRLHEDFGKYVDELADIDYEALSNNGVQTTSDLEDLIRLSADLDGLDKPGNGVSVTADAAFGVRVGHFGVGALGFSQVTGQVLDVDRDNLGLSTDVATIKADINSLVLDPSYNSGTYTMQIFTPAQAATLVADLGGDATASETVQRLDFVASQQNIDPADIPGMVDILSTSFQQSGTAANLADNTTTVLLKGFGVVEVPISYGHAINDHLSVGGNLKYMRGRVYGNQVLVFADDSGDTLEKSDEMYEESNNFGLDLGVMARMKMFSVGLVGRNLNSPKFDGFTKNILVNGQPRTITVEDVKLEPQVAAGLAFIPFETLTMEADIDLTRNETLFTNYNTQNLAFGLEWDAFRFLALRVGAYKNLAESDIGWVYTAGLGLNLWAMRLDVAGAMAADEERYDNEDYPVESRLALQLSVDF